LYFQGICIEYYCVKIAVKLFSPAVPPAAPTRVGTPPDHLTGSNSAAGPALKFEGGPLPQLNSTNQPPPQMPHLILASPNSPELDSTSPTKLTNQQVPNLPIPLR